MIAQSSLASPGAFPDAMDVERLLCISRKRDGFGGMQRLNADVWKCVRSDAGLLSHRIVPFGFFDLTFPFRVVAAGIILGLRGWRIHFGDCALTPLAAMIFFITRAPMTVTACGLDLLYPSVLYQAIIRRWLHVFHTVMCNSRATAEAAMSRGVQREKIAVIPCGIFTLRQSAAACGRVIEDFSSFRGGAQGEACLSGRQARGLAPACFTVPSVVAPDPTVLSIVSIGRFVPRKGFSWFIRSVLPLLHNDGLSFVYHLVGDGPERSAIKRALSEKNVSDHVRIHGALSEQKKNELLSGANIFVMPNVPREGDMEGFGIVCIEASSRGVPVVAARLEGITDAVLEGETGFFFTALDPHDCVRCIRSAMSFRAREAVAASTTKAFHWSVLWPRYRSILFPAS